MCNQTGLFFSAYGTPQTAGSKRAFPFKRKDGRLGVSVSDDNPKSKVWRSVVADAAREQYDGPLLDGPLRVSIHFYVQRPKGHYGTGKNASVLKPSAPPWPAKKPDVLKLTRAVEDALTGVLWVDDAQIVQEQISKYYVDRDTSPRVDVAVCRLI